MGADEPEQRTIAPGRSTIVDGRDGPVEVHARACPEEDDDPIWLRSALAVRMQGRVVARIDAPEHGDALTLDEAAALLARSGSARSMRLQLSPRPDDADAHAALLAAAKAGGGNVQLRIPPVDRG